MQPDIIELVKVIKNDYYEAFINGSQTIGIKDEVLGGFDCLCNTDLYKNDSINNPIRHLSLKNHEIKKIGCFVIKERKQS